MANDDLDLTFIRCPSCRSLVPATATRCRMCGYLLQGDEGENSEQSSDDTSLGQKGRVRQRTISLSEGERDEIKEKIAESDVPVGHGASDQFDGAPPRSAEEASFSTPDEFQTPVEQHAPNYHEQTSSEPSDIGFEEADADFEAEMRARRESLEAELARRSLQEQQVPEQVAHVEEDQTYQRPVEEYRPEAPSESFQQESKPEPVAAEPKRKRRRRKKKKRVEPEVAEAVEEESSSHIEKVDSVDAPSSPVQSPVESIKPKVAEVSFEQRVDVQSEKVGEEPMSNVGHVESVVAEEPRPEAIAATVEELRVEPRVQVSKVHNDGVLVAWFVYYQEDANGVATEIREGRFFLGSSRLKDNDIVVQHESISTPHCLIKADPQKGVFVQDLMSENGTFVKRADSDDWTPVPVPEQLNHGDWLKLGEYEVMVCIIPVRSSEADE